ncbi:solute carrier family 23 protein [Variovorax sp. J22R133]|uniref:solute carrier family 23 protein n=1 Tax=Variovorax brevis TaxID=3053503 RepID=UPI0025791268|nr:solute carrier family 23 protein [Variovorax sp. J22R133]MDM0115896.1 solute carrier family 23 protein [Variovorax sp. J22R133]
MTTANAAQGGALPQTRTRATKVHPVDEVLPLPQLAAYGFQHVLAFYAGAVLVPIILAGALGLSKDQLIHLINADLFTCGIASIIQAWGIGKVGVRLPLLQGVTFTAVSPMIAIGMGVGGGTDGLLAIYGSVLVAGIFTFLAAPYFAKLVRFFPPIVTGTVILIIGIALLPVAANDIVVGKGPFAIQDPVQFKHLAYAFGTLALIVAIQRMFRGFMATIAVLLGLVIGTIVAWILGDAHFADVATAPMFGYTSPFYFGIPTFSFTAVLSMLVVMMITMVETTGDVYATGEIVQKRIRADDIARAIRADGAATFLGGILNSFPYTCFAENVGLVRLTQIKSRWVVVAAGFIMIILGSLPKAAAIVAGIPHPVLGGAALAMFAAVAVVGVQTLQKCDFNDHRNIVILGTSLGLGMLVTAQPFVAGAFPKWAEIVFGSGITLGALSAIILNIIFNHTGGSPHTAVAGTPGNLIGLEQVNEMSRQEFGKTFGGLVEDTPWVLDAAYARRPYANTIALRAAFQEALLTSSKEEQLQLMNSFADLGSEADSHNAYLLDHADAGMSGLEEEEHNDIDELAKAYRNHFGFPLIVCARDVDRYERVVTNGWNRMANSAEVERAAGLIEIARIANYRFNVLVANANPISSARVRAFGRLSPHG